MRNAEIAWMCDILLEMHPGKEAIEAILTGNPGVGFRARVDRLFLIAVNSGYLEAIAHGKTILFRVGMGPAFQRPNDASFRTYLARVGYMIGVIWGKFEGNDERFEGDVLVGEGISYLSALPDQTPGAPLYLVRTVLVVRVNSEGISLKIDMHNQQGKLWLVIVRVDRQSGS